MINQNTVVVYTSLELKNYLEGNNSYNYIYFGDDDTVIPLSTTPTLVYSDSKNDGDIKTTIIQWKTNKGILLQVNKPLQNM